MIIISKSKNLDYDKTILPHGAIEESGDYIEQDLNQFIYKDFNDMDSGIQLNFENGRQASIKPISPMGDREIMLIRKSLKTKPEDFIGKSYKEILNTDFEEKVSVIP